MSLTPPGETNLVNQAHRLNIGAMFSLVAGVAVTWVALYKLNHWLFSDLHVTGFISWIFLPAAIRVLAVMFAGWAGALGLFIGSVVTNAIFADLPLLDVLSIAALSALGPLAAVHLCTRWLNLPDDLSGLQRWQLLVFAVTGAFFNVLPHNLYFYLTGMSDNLWTGVIPMFVGDLIGTLSILYVASLSIRLIMSRVRART